MFNEWILASPFSWAACRTSTVMNSIKRRGYHERNRPPRSEDGRPRQGHRFPCSNAVGTTMPGFVPLAAKEKALTLLDSELRVTLSQRDFAGFTAALNNAFTPNAALKGALTTAAKVKRA